MNICRAEKNHIPGLIALLRQVGQLHHRGRPDLFRNGALKYDETQLEALLADETCPVFVAEQDGQVLGYGFCKIKNCSDHPVFNDYREMYIDDICVDEACRGQHIGTAIYQEIFRYARLHKCHNITLNVWSFNQGAMRFYESCGMKPQRVFMETVLENEDAE